MSRVRVAAIAAVLGTATACAAGPTVKAGVFHSPRIPSSGPARATANAGWASSNWSGYAITGSGFTSVTGTWTVPAAGRSRHPTFSSNWIGIDGFNNDSLIQTGTESDFYNGGAHYDAWWEILPASETVIPSISVRPGDVMTATITQGGGDAWTITINDSRSGSYTTQQSYSGPQTSAEWIEEAPTVGGRIATLANYGTTTFDPGTVNGGNPGLTAADGGVMIQRGIQVSTPSSPDKDTDGFAISYGSAAPKAPSS